MPRKTLQVQVELDIQAVTCPGVWLCPNGKISLQVYMLDSCIQTIGLQPIFPLLYHEKFIFYKTFYTAHSLNDLHRFINKDYLYAELIQWQNCDIGNVLATFQTSLGDVLYPTAYEGALAGVDVDLLMEPSKSFPGIIAPKIEISTRTTIDEVVCSSNNNNKCTSCVVSHKTVQSDQNPFGSKHNPLHQQKVCHSLGYHKARRCTKLKRSNKPPFVIRKVEEELLGRKPQGLESGSTNKCKCCLNSQSTNYVLDKKGDFSSSQSLSEKTYTKLTDDFLKKYPKPTKMKPRCTDKGVYPKKTQMCSCGSGHSQENCPVCSKYRHYFEGNMCSCKSPTKTVRPGRKCSPVKESYVRKVTTCSPTRDHYRQSSRSPVRSVGKEHQRQFAVKARPCSCSSPKTTRYSSQQQRLCDCTPTCNDDNSSKHTCFCSLRKKPSLAEQIHHRLKRTLDCVPPTYQSVDQQSESDSPGECSCLYYRNCREEFSKNLGKFYKDLRSC